MALAYYLAVGDNGTIIKRSEGGVWSAKTSGVSAHLRFITGTPGGSIYVGGVETLLVSINGGETWSDISSSLTWTAGEYVSQICILDASNIYIATSLRLLHWDGASTFTELRNSTHVINFQQYVGCWATSTSNVWVTAYSSSYRAVLYYNGTGWTTQTYQYWAGRYWGLGSDIYQKGGLSTSDPRVTKWVDVATDWATVVDEAGYIKQEPYPAIHGSAANNIVAAQGGTLGKIGVSRYNGTSWTTTLLTGSATLSQPRWIHVNSPADAAIAMRLGQVHIQTAAPETWTVEEPATTGTSEDLYGIWSPGDSAVPYLKNQTPEPGKTARTPRGPIAFTITDDGGDVVQATVEMWVNDLQVYDGSSFIAGWSSASSITESSGDQVVVLEPPEDFTERVAVVRVVAQDEFSNEMDKTFAVLLPLADRAPLDGWEISDDGTYRLDGGGHITRDSVITRARIRLRVRRGQWLGDANIGSRIHEIQTTKDVDQKLRAMVLEALQPLIDEGALLSVDVGPTFVDHLDGKVAARVTSELPAQGAAVLGYVKLE